MGTQVRESYTDMNARIQREVDALPLHWAFGKSQWVELLAELGISEAEAPKKLCKGPGGSILLKSDVEVVASTLNRHAEELDAAMKDIDFFKEAVMYEMQNHEYHINYQGDYDVLSALGFDVKYEKEFECTELTDEMKAAYMEVRNEFYRLADENGWY